MTPASFSLDTSSSTSATLLPASLTGGSCTDVTLRQGLMSTPKFDADSVVSGFFLAFYEYIYEWMNDIENKHTVKWGD